MLYITYIRLLSGEGSCFRCLQYLINIYVIINIMLLFLSDRKIIRILLLSSTNKGSLSLRDLAFLVAVLFITTLTVIFCKIIDQIIFHLYIIFSTLIQSL